ncbi:hypothetical protein UQ82_24820, partial [Shigella dysenteriae]
VQTTDTQYQYSDVNVIAIHHALVKSGITRWSNQASRHRRWMWLSPCH